LSGFSTSFASSDSGNCISWSVCAFAGNVPSSRYDRRFNLEVLDVDEGEEVLVRLRVLPALGSDTATAAPAEQDEVADAGPEHASADAKAAAKSAPITEVDAEFRVGFFDFPMIDNTRLSGL
jgi:hypothetical protein